MTRTRRGSALRSHARAIKIVLEVGARECPVERPIIRRMRGQHVHCAVEHLRALDQRLLPIGRDVIAMAFGVAPRLLAQAESTSIDADRRAIGRAYSFALHTVSLRSERAQYFGDLFPKE